MTGFAGVETEGVDRGAMGLRIVLAGGGSGGHVYPALAILSALMRAEPDLAVLYIGTRHGVEARIVPERQIPFVDIQAEGILGRGLKQKAGAMKMATYGFWQARRSLKRFDGEIVLATGGYVSGPVGMAAVTLGIPLVLQEQNVWPGMTNRMLARFARLVLTPYPESRNYFPRGTNIQVAPNPVAEPTSESPENLRRDMGLSLETKILMVTGGSQGAGRINEWIVSLLPDFIADPHYGLLWATGPRYFDQVQRVVAENKWELDRNRIRIQPYFDAIASSYRVSDLFLGRAGAMTIADCLSYRLPMILVPSPNVSEDHQTKNARELEKAGAAVMILESDLGPKAKSQVFGLLDDADQRAFLSEQARPLYDRDAAPKMAEMVREIYRKTRGERK